MLMLLIVIRQRNLRNVPDQDDVHAWLASTPLEFYLIVQYLMVDLRKVGSLCYYLGSLIEFGAYCDEDSKDCARSCATNQATECQWAGCYQASCRQEGCTQIGCHQAGCHQAGSHQIGCHQAGSHQIGWHQAGSMRTSVSWVKLSTCCLISASSFCLWSSTNFCLPS